ncbi:MAG: transglutaminase family protein [Hyphomicrobiales bacterium]|nr:transglutaminase family protein [Hyphomicrobiales bacterium]MDE2114450.1 transglutaminase family protein [Hyphomicrobiales bacterium]
MRLRVQHATTYTYADPAQSAIQILRLTPRNHDGQYVNFWRVEVDADYRLVRDEDPFGNITHTFSLEGPIATMTIRVEGEVETTNNDGIVAGTAERMPRNFWLRDTQLTRADAAIRMFSRRIAAGEGGEALPYLHALNNAIHSSIEFTPGSSTVATSAAQAFAGKRGVCQDLAQIFVAACRVVKIPARYVGGYFLRTDQVEQDAGHAWAEAYVEGLGWMGFDPAHGLCTTDRYVRVAYGADAADAAPIRGARIGGHDEQLKVEVHVSKRREFIED